MHKLKRITNDERTDPMTFSDTARPMACDTHPRHPRSGGSVFGALVRLHDVWRQRQVLRALDGDALNDIGLSRRDALSEAQRSVWDVPATWRA
jgi:uncharacterized protein YjiS (DUF1127 family)